MEIATDRRLGRQIFLRTSQGVFRVAGRGPAPKPAHLRQRRNKKAGAATLTKPTKKPKVPTLPNPQPGEWKWHRLTRAWWRKVWTSPMASEYLETDIDGLARLAILVDQFYKSGDPKLMSEIRLQEARFGLSPVDRSRLQWEVQKGEEAERKRQPRSQSKRQEPHKADPRGILGVVK